LDYNNGKMTASLSLRLNHLLVEHCTNYPHLQVQDVYKFLYQAAMGSGHAVPDSTRARSWLEDELSHLIPDANQPLIEQISPERNRECSVVRVNLRPYLAASNNPDLLMEAFVRTANEFEGSIQRLERYTSLLCQLPSLADSHFSITDLESFMTEMRNQDFPAIHHSELYTRHYQPAYRVVAQEFLEPVLGFFGN
jgi:hypothetical protein